MYASRKCFFTKRPILPREQNSVQMHFAVLDENGRTTEEVKIVDICGDLRSTGRTDFLLYEATNNKSI